MGVRPSPKYSVVANDDFDFTQNVNNGIIELTGVPKTGCGDKTSFFNDSSLAHLDFSSLITQGIVAYARNGFSYRHINTLGDMNCSMLEPMCSDYYNGRAVRYFCPDLRRD